MNPRRRPLLIWAATSALGLLQATGGCICEKGDAIREGLPGDDPNDPHVDPRAPPLSKESVIWDFRKSGEPPLISLWPKDPTAPWRKHHDARVEKRGELLIAETKSVDAWLLWQFETPLHFATLSVELTSPVADALKLYWTSVECATFTESCSSAQPVIAGRQFVDLVPGTARAIREVRLDLPARAGVKVEFHQVRLFGKPVLRGSGDAHDANTTVQSTAQGLVLESTRTDPWVRFPTPWLTAARAESVELELSGSVAPAPQLFWVGEACPQFGEECSVALAADGPGGRLFRARLRGAPKWSGKIQALRLDPANAAGRYVVHRMRLVRPGTK